MRKTVVLLVFLLLASTQLLMAQSKEINGTVRGQDNKSLPFVTVSVKGTTNGAITNSEGQFTLQAKSSDTLLVSFVGMETQLIPVGSKTIFNIVLLSSATNLDEVVVIAYGTTKKSSFTGSASVVKAEALKKMPVESFEKALQGNTAGLQVSTASGAPGSATTIRVRGVGSLNASSSPLYVIDGVPISSSNNSQVASDDYGTSSSPMASINPADIESITVLKDASAASLYGSRAANGVVIITTKSGNKGDAKIKFRAKTGVSTYAVEPHSVLGGSDYYKTYYNYYLNNNLSNGLVGTAASDAANASTIAILGANPFNTATPFNAEGNLTDGTELYYDTDWRDAIYQTGKTYDVNMSAAGGNEKTKYYISGGYLNQEGNVVGYDYERYSAKVNLNSKLKENIKVGINNTLSFSEQNTPAGGGGAANAVRFSNVVANVYPLYQRKADGTYNLDANENRQYDYSNPIVMDFNPLGINEMDIYKSETSRAITSAWAELSFLNDFKFKTQGSVDYNALSEQRYYNPIHGNGASVGGRSNIYKIRDIRTNITNTLHYSKNIDGDNSISVLVGQEAFKSNYSYFSGGKTNFIFGGTEHMIAASTPTELTSYTTQKTLASYFSSVKLNNQDKYYLDLSYRRDGSSVFGIDTKWGDFYSVGATWRIKEESFMKDYTWVNDLKLRGSFGTSGNDNIGRYDAQGQLGFGYNYNGAPGMYYDNMSNPILQWETSKILDIGLEFRIFDDFTGVIDYYNKVSSDLLFERPLSMTTGFENIMSNLAEMKNSGLEILLNTNNIRNDNFSWTSDFNFTYNVNEITELTQEQLIVGSKIWEEGGDRYQFYIQEWAGVDAATGEPMWYMDNEEGEKVLTKTYSQATKYRQGSSLPDFFGGVTNTFSYNDFQFSFFFYYSVGGKTYDYTEAALMHDGSEPGKQLSSNVDDAWQQAGDVTSVPQFIPNNSNNSNDRSTRFLHDGSYVRLKNVSLSYTLPKSISEKMHFTNMNVYVQASNLLTLTKHKGLDPEVSIAGTTNNNIPPVKTVSFGVNIDL
ncbi:MAG: TonB-dependent receptor [Bacteroidota bacterium]|nr:TonB-dependent receptor [Bacteroidota bacterium]